MLIYIDLDGVVFNTHEILIEIYNKIYQKNLTINDINKWNYFPKKIFKKIYFETCKQIDNFLLIDSFIPYFMFLFNNKYNVDILTHQGNNKKKLKECLYRLGIRKRFEYNKLIKPKRKKKKIDYMKDRSIIIDDNPFLIDDIKYFTSKYLLLFNTPWNKSYDCKPYRNVFRVHNWVDICEKIQQLEKILINDISEL